MRLGWWLTVLDRDWGFDDVPRTEIGKFYLTQNPRKQEADAVHFASYFVKVEQATFSP